MICGPLPKAAKPIWTKELPTALLSGIYVKFEHFVCCTSSYQVWSQGGMTTDLDACYALWGFTSQIF